jgi:hypothetical protein
MDMVAPLEGAALSGHVAVREALRCVDGALRRGAAVGEGAR